MKILGIYGSPRRGGNTALLLDEALRGAQEEGAETEKLVLRDLKISPCLEIYACKKDGRCVIKDDFLWISDKLAGADRIILGSPVMFYNVSAHAKILIDRCQAFWVKKHDLKEPINPEKPDRRGYGICVGATQGRRLFEGMLLTIRYFFDALDVSFDRKQDVLLIRGVDEKGEVLEHPEMLKQAYELGRHAVRK